MSKVIVIDVVEESITELYDRVAVAMGKEVSDDLNYDCKKIEVSKDIADAIERRYSDTMSFSMAWLCFGPKVNEDLKNGEVLVDEGFFILPDANLE